jgi:hypothetical protein
VSFILQSVRSICREVHAHFQRGVRQGINGWKFDVHPTAMTGMWTAITTTGAAMKLH